MSIRILDDPGYEPTEDFKAWLKTKQGDYSRLALRNLEGNFDCNVEPIVIVSKFHEGKEKHVDIR